MVGKRNPVIVAGLMGVSASLVPLPALAMTMTDAALAFPLSGPLALGLGLIGGAAVGAGVAWKVCSRRFEAASEAEGSHATAAESDGESVCANNSSEGGSETGVAEVAESCEADGIKAASTVEPASELASAETSDDFPSNESGQDTSVFLVAASRLSGDGSNVSVGDTSVYLVAAGAKPEDTSVFLAAAGMLASRNVSSESPDDTSVYLAAAACSDEITTPDPKADSIPSEASNQDDSAADLPEMEAVFEDTQTDVATKHAADDYEEVAENYVKGLSLGERLARGAGGVAEAFMNRINSGRMRGVPVIERGSAVASSLTSEEASTSTPVSSGPLNLSDTAVREIAIPSDFTLTDKERLVSAAERVSRASEISGRVAYVDGDVYPELRTIDDLSAPDDWSQALAALDEKLSASSPVFSKVSFTDSIGGIETIDEPDNLELDTSFIPFKTPAGHPEVTDTSSYVDYLIGEEFSKNSSASARRSSSRFLRVIDGGSQPMHRLSNPDRTGATYVGKHFAFSEAMEA